MPISADQRTLYKSLLEDQVLKDDLHGLLKNHKEDNKEEIRLSGSKGDLIDNLLDAVDQDIIPLTTVQMLIKDSEEFGDQHIFVYQVLNDTFVSKYNDGSTLASVVIPSAIRSQFPRLISIPTALEWADFRFPNRGVANSWVMKLYDVKTREVKENERFDSITNKRFLTYKTEESRLVYVVEWDGESELELKISRTSFDSWKGLQASVGQVKREIHAAGRGVVVDQDFTRTNLTVGINNIIENSKLNSDIYKIISANFVDSEGAHAMFKAKDDQGNHHLLGGGSREAAVNAYLDGDGMGTGLVIRFLASGSNGVLNNDYNIVIGRNEINEIIIPAKLKPQEYKYVRRKIAEFS